MDMKAIIKMALFTPGVNGRWGLPLIFKAKPGSAKTATVQSSAKEWSLYMETMLGSLRDPTDFIGLPFPVAMKDGSTRSSMLAAPFAHRLVDAKRGVCFLDELNLAPESVFAAMLRMVLEGVCGELQLPPEIRFLAAMNDAEDSAGGRPLPPPMANRFGHVEFEAPSAESWGDWALTGATSGDAVSAPQDPAAEERRVMEAWEVPYAKSRGLITAFVRKFPQLLNAMPPVSDPRSSGAFPTPRSWEMTMRSVAGCEVHALGAVESDMMVQAFVGEAAAKQFVVYKKMADLPDPIEVLDGKVKFVHNEQKLDRTIAVLSSCAALVTSPNAAKRDDRADRLWTILDGVCATAPDVAVPAVRALAKAKVRLFTKFSEPVLTKLNPVLEAAGLIKKGNAKK